jgi:hypothetical protein
MGKKNKPPTLPLFIYLPAPSLDLVCGEQLLPRAHRHADIRKSNPTGARMGSCKLCTIPDPEL